jgi:hypothetical protein
MEEAVSVNGVSAYARVGFLVGRGSRMVYDFAGAASMLNPAFGYANTLAEPWYVG